jgi:hypothetical protein
VLDVANKPRNRKRSGNAQAIFLTDDITHPYLPAANREDHSEALKYQARGEVFYLESIIETF